MPGSPSRCWSRAAALGYIAVFAAGMAAGAAACVAASRSQSKRLKRKLKKMERMGQERVHWAAVNKEMLGCAPRLWMEVLDRKHRYAQLLANYWRRWQLSDSRDNFFDWLDAGKGSMIDLPWAPRRLLDEWQVIYLKREEQPLFRVRLEPSTGRFLWEADGAPVTVPDSQLLLEDPAMRTSSPSAASSRAWRVDGLLRPLLERTKRRDSLLAAARREVEEARRRREAAAPRRLQEIAAPLIEEGLLCRLRDRYFEDRLDAAPTPDGKGHAHFDHIQELPSELLPGLGWDDFVKALDHDQLALVSDSSSMTRNKKDKGIFVLDSFGPLYCGTKITGLFHHSSFVRGHCIKVAGGITIRDGWLVTLSPHSGHYQPSEEHVNDMIRDWKERGVDFSRVKIEPYIKNK